MLRLEVLFLTLVLATGQDLMGVNYSFDVDFYSNFNYKRCENESLWRLERYEALKIEPPFADSDKGIQAEEKSCASSFPIIFLGGTLELNVYVRVYSQKYRISIEVFDEDDKPIARYAYGRLSEGFASGWRILSLKIDKYTKGYINLRGRSLSNETIIIDSFRYTPNNSAYKQNVPKIDYDNEDEEIIFNYRDNIEDEIGMGNSDLIDDIEGSGDLSPPIDPPTDTETNSAWNPLTIFLSAFGVVVVISGVAAGAYYFGKNRARNNEPSFMFEEEIDIPPTIRIPRAFGTPDSRSDFMRF